MSILQNVQQFLAAGEHDTELPASVSRLLQSTRTKVRQSLDICREALGRFDQNEISVSFNGGKDCLVMLYLYIAAMQERAATQGHAVGKIPCVYVFYEETFRELEAFNTRATETYNLDLGWYGECKMKQGFQQYLDEFPQTKAIVVGNRRTDPFSQKLHSFHPTDNDWPSFVRVHPILEWRYAEIWCFLLSLGIEYCELYDQGYTSLGGVHSTIKNPFLKKSDFAQKNAEWDKDVGHWMSEMHRQTFPNAALDPEYLPAFYLQNDNNERCCRR